jgi:hypothetical protein
MALTAEQESAERRRRALLDASDQILNEVEELRLENQRHVPKPLRMSIENLQVNLGGSDAPLSPSTLRSAHELVLAVQHGLLSSNPRSGTPRTHPGRAAGQSTMRRLAGGGKWKLLTLPPPSGAADGAWIELVDGTVERALDRWSYAQHHAAQAARERSGARPSLVRAAAAWANYWELAQEAARLRRGGHAGHP